MWLNSSQEDVYGFDMHHCQAWPIKPLMWFFLVYLSFSIFTNWCWCPRWPCSHMLLINTAPPPFGNLAWLHRMGGGLVFFSPHPSCTCSINKMKNVVRPPRLHIDTKSRDDKSKKKRNYITLKTFNTAKETINKMIKQPIERKKLLVSHTSDKGLISDSTTATAKKKKKDKTRTKKWLKIGGGSKHTFSKYTYRWSKYMGAQITAQQGSEIWASTC